MKRIFTLSVILASAAAAVPPPPQPDRFSLIGPAFKQPRELPATFFNPFKSQSVSAALARKETPSITNETVSDAVIRRGISGVVLSADAATNQVVLGDEVFAPGDEIVFADPRQPGVLPLINGATVVLSAIRPENLDLEIKVDGEAPRHLVYPLHNFWAR